MSRKHTRPTITVSLDFKGALIQWIERFIHWNSLHGYARNVHELLQVLCVDPWSSKGDGKSSGLFKFDSCVWREYPIPPFLLAWRMLQMVSRILTSNWEITACAMSNLRNTCHAPQTDLERLFLPWKCKIVLKDWTTTVSSSTATS